MGKRAHIRPLIALIVPPTRTSVAVRLTGLRVQAPTLPPSPSFACHNSDWAVGSVSTAKRTSRPRVPDSTSICKLTNSQTHSLLAQSTCSAWPSTLGVHVGGRLRPRSRRVRDATRVHLSTPRPAPCPLVPTPLGPLQPAEECCMLIMTRPSERVRTRCAPGTASSGSRRPAAHSLVSTY